MAERGEDLDEAAPASAIRAPEQSDDIRQLLSGIKSEVSALMAEILGELRVIGISELPEGPRPTSFMESLLLDVFGSDSSTKLPAVDCAHHSLAPMLKQHEPPRPMIVRLHHFQTRERIFQLAQEKGQLQFQGNQIHIYPGFSAEVARRRAAFTVIKPQLRKAGMEYGLLFPAHLRINHKGVKHVFESPQQVTAFLQGLNLSPRMQAYSECGYRRSTLSGGLLL
ncbi:hypothetical protein SRHO_G00237600 [Serrasalmus rhombeus]